MLRRAASLPCVRGFRTTVRRRQGPADNLYEGPKEHTCGIPTWRPPVIPPPPTAASQFPSFLVRPPCLPGSKPGDIQTCIRGQEGFYCPPCRFKYKYPAFSENIDFMPSSVQPPCWWKFPPSCKANVDEAVLATLTKRWACAYDGVEWPVH